MKVTLNSRTLVGPHHAQAAAFASEWPPSGPVLVEWVQSSSARCVLDVDIPEDHRVILKGTVQPLDGNDARSQLEIELRENVGLPPFNGDDADGSERAALL